MGILLKGLVGCLIIALKDFRSWFISIIALSFFLPALQAQLTVLNGTFKYPDATTLTGKVVITLARSTVTNTCITPVQVTSFRQVTVKITNGVLGTISLYATPCLLPKQNYVAKVYDGSNRLLYSAFWNIPKVSPQNVIAVDIKEQ
jgi:hypothetical protein